MTDRTPLDVAGVARELGHTPLWFRRHRAELEAKHGFPKPLPGLGLRWDPLAIKLWKDIHIPAALRPEPVLTGNDNWDTTLDARAALLAAGVKH